MPQHPCVSALPGHQPAQARPLASVRHAETAYRQFPFTSQQQQQDATAGASAAPAADVPFPHATHVSQPQAHGQAALPFSGPWPEQVRNQLPSPGRQDAAASGRSRQPALELCNRSGSSSASEQDLAAAMLFLEPQDDLAAGAVWRSTKSPSLSVMYRQATGSSTSNRACPAGLGGGIPAQCTTCLTESISWSSGPP